MKKAAGPEPAASFDRTLASACGSVPIIGAGPANAAARARRLDLDVGIGGTHRFALIVASADRRRQDGEIDAFVIVVTRRLANAAAIVLVANPSVGPVAAPFGPLVVPPVAYWPIAARLGAVVAGTNRPLLRPLVAIAIKLAIAVIVAVGLHPIVALIFLIVVVA